MFDLNVAAQEFDGGRQEFGENAIEAMFEERLIPVTTSSNACSSMLHTVGTGETIASEDSDDEDKIQSQEVSCSPQDAFELTSMVFDSCEQARSYYNKYAKRLVSQSRLEAQKMTRMVKRTKLCLCATEMAQTKRSVKARLSNKGKGTKLKKQDAWHALQ